MRTLYCTADNIGTETGGGIVTKNELEALRSVSDDVFVLSRDDIACQKFKQPESPFLQDYFALQQVQNRRFDLAHFYSGCFSQTIAWLKSRGVKVSYTIAAHDRRLSIEEFHRLGMEYPFHHIKDDDLWQIYTEGIRLVDVVIAPSNKSAEILKSDVGCKNVVVIPHGVDLPKEVKPIPDDFKVGYLGGYGPDKGVLYLIQSWAMLNYPDSRLILAGDGTETLEPFIRQVADRGQFVLQGRIGDASELYNVCSVYVQPSVTEGFGIEVLEAMACFPYATNISTDSILATHVRHYSGKVYIMQTETGQIEATENHPFMTNDGWVLAKDLSNNLRLLYNSNYEKNIYTGRIGEIAQSLPHHAIKGDCQRVGQAVRLGVQSKVQNGSPQAIHTNQCNEISQLNERGISLHRGYHRRRRNSFNSHAFCSEEMEAVYSNIKLFIGINGMAQIEDIVSMRRDEREPQSSETSPMCSIILFPCIRNIIPSTLQGFVPLSSHQKTAHGFNYRMVRSKVESVKSRTSNRTTTRYNQTNPLYESQAIQKVTTREVTDLPVYNLTTENGIYFANGFLVHNCGRPVIVTEGAGASELVEDSFGFVVPIRDPRAIATRINWFRENRDKIPEMGQRAREKAKNYTWKKIMKMYAKLFLG